MQVPEKLSLIGGSILLASTLVFTLKSQASNILPKVDSGISEMFKNDQERQQDQQKQQQEQAFNDNFQQAQQKGWQTGMWGSAKFYVDDQHGMHVGSGQLSDSFSKVVNDKQIKAINLEGNVQAPRYSNHLFANNNNNFIPLSQINGLSNLDTSNVTDMSSMFNGDASLTSLDLSHFDTHNVNDMGYMFSSDNSLSNLYIGNFDTHNVNDMGYMFYGDISLNNLDLSHFDTRNVNYMSYMFFYDNGIHQLNLGNDTKLNVYTYLSGTYQNNGQTSSLIDGNAHPGTWVRQ